MPLLTSSATALPASPPAYIYTLTEAIFHLTPVPSLTITSLGVFENRQDAITRAEKRTFTDEPESETPWVTRHTVVIPDVKGKEYYTASVGTEGGFGAVEKWDGKKEYGWQRGDLEKEMK
ncbi:MAG: hypothetical protein Q9181_000326 [Wetmoreana brouardii]